MPPLPTRWNFVSDFNCGDPEWNYIGCCHSLGSTLVCWENWQLGTWENKKTPEVLWCSSTIKKHTRTHRTKARRSFGWLKVVFIWPIYMNPFTKNSQETVTVRLFHKIEPICMTWTSFRQWASEIQQDFSGCTGQKILLVNQMVVNQLINFHLRIYLEMIQIEHLLHMDWWKATNQFNLAAHRQGFRVTQPFPIWRDITNPITLSVRS